MSDFAEREWKLDLTSILEELSDEQFKKMLQLMGKIPGSMKTLEFRQQMPGMIIQHYGLLDSIREIDDIMQKIPRRDPIIQNLLQPHVDRLREPENNDQGKKRKREEDGVLTDATATPCRIQNQQESSQADNERSAKAKPWEKSIRDVKSAEALEEPEGFRGKVVQKSGLRPYRNRTRAKKCFFFLGVADGTASVKVKAYGKDRYEELQEQKSYLFHRGLVKEEDVVMVTAHCKVTQVGSVAVPEELEQDATELVYPERPARSIEEAKASGDKTRVSVGGAVTEIDPVRRVKVSYQRQKVQRQDFRLKDETGSIRISMWDEGAVASCRGLSVGDEVQLFDVKTNDYYGDVSLNSTGTTRLLKLQSVGVQKARVEIIGIKKATKKETQLEAEVEGQLHTFVVATPLLMKTLGLKLGGGFKDRLLDATPLAADVETRGNKITAMTAASAN